ncbi:MAG: SRPBCC domain-containing protein [Pseudomonadota bacterium]
MNSDNKRASSSLPYPTWWPVLGGALFGVVLRLIFWGGPHFPLSAMHPAFIGFAPLAVGAVTVYIAELTERRSWSYYLFAGMLSNFMFILATMLILIEGVICAILILPLFAAYGALSGAAMGAICRITNWPKKTAVYSFAALPLLLGVLLPGGPSEPYLGAIERTVIVNAGAPAVWRQLHDARDIKAQEVGRAWMYRIGVPTPLSGIARATPDGMVRDVRMGKGIHFTQLATRWEPNRHVKWDFKFKDDSFPPGALDDHVKIGGEYFDLIDAEYVLVPLSPARTALTLRMHYRLSTGFNWYAKLLASGLIGNFEEVILDFYASRAAQKGKGPRLRPLPFATGTA